MAKTKVIKINPLNLATIEVTIEGDSDLILNKMDDITRRKLIRKFTNQPVDIEEPNEWEEIITSMHWRDGKPKEFTEETFKDALKNNAPCITTFGLSDSFSKALVRSGLEKKSTSFRDYVRVIPCQGLVPIKYAEHNLDINLVPAKMGVPVLSRQNRFTGWTATFKVQYVEGGVYSLEQILQVINLAGFGGGIGSGRDCGFGRYHIVDVKGA